jgi:hypothetical protein
MNDHLAVQSQVDSDHRVQRCWSKADAGDIDDGLSGGFLAGAIVEVWVALRLDWACA